MSVSTGHTPSNTDSDQVHERVEVPAVTDALRPQLLSGFIKCLNTLLSSGVSSEHETDNKPSGEAERETEPQVAQSFTSDGGCQCWKRLVHGFVEYAVKQHGSTLPAYIVELKSRSTDIERGAFKVPATPPLTGYPHWKIMMDFLRSRTPCEHGEAAAEQELVKLWELFEVAVERFTPENARKRAVEEQFGKEIITLDSRYMSQVSMFGEGPEGPFGTKSFCGSIDPAADPAKNEQLWHWFFPDLNEGGTYPRSDAPSSNPLGITSEEWSRNFYSTSALHEPGKHRAIPVPTQVPQAPTAAPTNRSKFESTRNE